MHGVAVGEGSEVLGPGGSAGVTPAPCLPRAPQLSARPPGRRTLGHSASPPPIPTPHPGSVQGAAGPGPSAQEGLDPARPDSRGDQSTQPERSGPRSDAQASTGVSDAPRTLGRCPALRTSLLRTWARSDSLPVIAHGGHLQFHPKKTGIGGEESRQEAKGEKSVPARVHPKAGPGMHPPPV